MFCSRCGTALAERVAECPSCGAPVRSGGGQHSAPANSSGQSYRFDMARWSQADKIVGGASLLLLISLFLPWFSVSVSLFGKNVSGSGSGLDAHGYLWLTFIVCLAVIAFLGLEAGFDTLPFSLPASREMLLLAATGLNLLIVLIAFFVKPATPIGSVSWSFGAFIALVAAIAACAPLAVPTIRARSARAGA
jgi:zinc-ribbon domain